MDIVAGGNLYRNLGLTGLVGGEDVLQLVHGINLSAAFHFAVGKDFQRYRGGFFGLLGDADHKGHGLEEYGGHRLSILHGRGPHRGLLDMTGHFLIQFLADAGDDLYIAHLPVFSNREHGKQTTFIKAIFRITQPSVQPHTEVFTTLRGDVIRSLARGLEVLRVVYMDNIFHFYSGRCIFDNDDFRKNRAGSFVGQDFFAIFADGDINRPGLQAQP